MPELSYVAPVTIHEAVNHLASHQGLAKILCGGTDLLVQMRTNRIVPTLIVDIKKIKALCGIEAQRDGGFIVGAATPGYMVQADKDFKAAWPGVAQAMDLIGSTQVQGRCSMGGNLCNASPAADSVPALMAADAVAIIVGANGEREVPVEKIPIAPGRTCLKNDEILTAFRFRARPPGSSDAYLRMTPRTEMDIASVGCAVSVTLDREGRCTDARVALGAVAPTAIVVSEAAATLIGHKLDDQTLARLGLAAQAGAKPISDKRATQQYRHKIIAVLAQRCARIAFERANARQH